MSQTAETLRNIARGIRDVFDHGYTTKHEEAAACEAGARAWEIVEKLSRVDAANTRSFACAMLLEEFVSEAHALLDAEGR